MLEEKQVQKSAEQENVLEEMEESKNILIWGAAYNTEEVLRFYKDFFEGKCLQIVDKNKADEYICGYEIMAPDSIIYANIDLVAIMSSNYHDEIEYILRYKYGYKGIIVGLYAFRRRLLREDAYNECTCHIEDFIKHMESGRQSYSYEYIYKEKYSKYKKIKLFALWTSSIGESIRYLSAYYDSAFKNKKENEYYLLVPYIDGNDFANGRFIEAVSRTVPMITYENCHFWQYLLKKHPDRFDLKSYNDYNGILVDGHNQFDERMTNGFFLDRKFPIISYTAEEMDEVRNKLKEMEVLGDYVCVFARDSAYYQYQWGKADSFVDIRNMDMASFQKATEYLYAQGIRAVRMGKVVNQSVISPNCIDYASKYHSDLMDLYLLGKCKFYAGSVSGIVELAQLQDVPVVLLGVVQLGMYNSVPCRSSDIYIPKKLYDKKNKRTLNFTEMWDAEMAAKRKMSRYYIEHELEFIELSEDEINEAVIEMNEKIDGVYVEDAYEKELQKKYHDLLNNWIERNGYQHFYFLHINISGSFIKRNTFLLEESGEH